MTATTGDRVPTSAAALRTKRSILRVALRRPSVWFVVVASSLVALARFRLGEWGLADALVTMVAIALVGPTEWAVHRHLFHAPGQSFRRRRLGIGRDHDRHHTDPDALDTVLLSARGAVLMSLLLACFVALWALPMAVAIGSAAAVFTAITVGLISLLHYEWTHLMAHSRYRPQSARYRRLARNHLRHHHRSDRHWLGVTTNLGDRLFATLPAEGGG